MWEAMKSLYLLKNLTLLMRVYLVVIVVLFASLFQITSASQVSVDDKILEVHRGDTSFFLITIKNRCNKTETYSISIDSEIDDWIELEKTSLSIKAGDKENVICRITVPYDTSSNEYDVLIKVDNGSKVEQVKVKVVVVKGDVWRLGNMIACVGIIVVFTTLVLLALSVYITGKIASRIFPEVDVKKEKKKIPVEVISSAVSAYMEEEEEV